MEQAEYTADGQRLINWDTSHEWGDRFIPRWHCYHVKPLPTLPNLAFDWNKHHGLLYPTQALDLINFTKNKIKGEFPGVKDLNWDFCCSLLRMCREESTNMLTGTAQPSNDEMMDSDCDALVYLLNDFEILTSSVSDADRAYTIMNWLKGNHAIKFTEIYEKLPKDYFDILLYICEKYGIITTSVTDSDIMYNLYTRLKEQP